MNRSLLTAVFSLAGVLFLVAGCNPVGIDPEADLTITGRIVDASGQSVADVEVAWLTNDATPMNFLGWDILGYDTYNSIGEGADRRFDYVTTGTDGVFTFEIKGKEANTADSTADDLKAAYHHILVNQTPETTNGFAIAMSIDHTFTPDGGFTWDLGNVSLWNDPAAALDTPQDHVVFSWSALDGADAYYVKVRDADGDYGWQQSLATSILSLPVEAIHPTREYDAKLAVWSANDYFTYRTQEVSLPDSLARSDNILQENTTWYAENGDQVDVTSICNELANNSISSDCNISSLQDDWNEILFDFDDGKGDPVTTAEYVSMVIIYNSDITAWDDTCLYVDVYPNLMDDMGDITPNQWNTEAVQAGYTCGHSTLGDVWAAVELSQPDMTRYLRIRLERQDSVTAQTHFTRIGEIGIY